MAKEFIQQPILELILNKKRPDLTSGLFLCYVQLIYIKFDYVLSKSLKVDAWQAASYVIPFFKQIFYNGNVIDDKNKFNFADFVWLIR